MKNKLSANFTGFSEINGFDVFRLDFGDKDKTNESLKIDVGARFCAMLDLFL